MRKIGVISLVLIVAVFVSGCTDVEKGVFEPARTATAPAFIIITPTVQHTLPTVAPVPPGTTAQTTPKPTTILLSGLPLTSQISIIVAANGSERFEAQNPGRVRIAASTHLKEPDCDRPGALILTGDNFETILAASSLQTVRETITLPSAGTYTFTSRGCYRWTVKMENY